MLKKIINLDFPILLLLLFILSLISKSLLIIIFPGKLGGDTLEYLNIAKNILVGCGISNSNLEIENCVLTAGGARGPGYPIILSFLLFFHSKSYFHLLFFNAFVLSLSILYLIYSLKDLFYSRKIFLFSSIILVSSPLTIGWPRSILTESIAISMTVFFFGYLFNLLIKNKINNLNIITLSLIVSFSAFVRIELIFLNIISLLFFFKYMNFSNFVKKSIIYILVFIIPWSIWSARNIYHGIQIIPQHAGYDFIRIKSLKDNFYDQENTPDGYYKWVGTWLEDQYQRAGAIFPISSKNYQSIFINYNKVSNNEILNNKSRELIEKLKKSSGKSIPKSLDNDFKTLSLKIINDDRLHYYLLLPTKRIYKQLFNLTTSNGLPTEFNNLSYEERYNIKSSDYKSILIFIKNNFINVSIKVFSNIWRIIIIFSLLYFFYLVIFIKKNLNYEKETIYRNIIILTFCFFIIKCIFTGYTTFFETRFFVNIIPILEIVFFILIDKTIYEKMHYKNYQIKIRS